MTAIRALARPKPRASRRRAHSAMPVVVVAAAAGVLTTVLRLVGLRHALDIFVDEPLYAELGHSVKSGGFPMVDGARFFLHPPGFFYLEAGWERLFGSGADIVDSIYKLRPLNAVIAGATASALVLLVARAGSLRAAAATGALFALDPFCIRQNGRVLLETAMMFWVLLGYIVVLPIGFARLRCLPPVAADSQRLRAICAGLLFGLAVITKDEAVLVTVVPLLVAAVARRTSRQRPLFLLAAGTTAVPYVIYVITVAAAGHLDEFWAAKSSGVLRLLGLLQITGFNAPGAPSLASRLLDELPYFGTTYALLATSIVALVFLIRRGGPSERLLGVFFAAAVARLGYAVLFGTLEEQSLYIMVVPAFAVVGVAAALVEERYVTRRALEAMLVTVLAVVIALDNHTYLQWRLNPDDGYVQLRTYMAAHVPAGARVAAADGDTRAAETGDVLGPSARILGDRYRVTRWLSPAEQARKNVRFLVVPWREVDEGYSYLTRSDTLRVIKGARPLFALRDRTYGRLVLYRLPRPARRSATAGVRSATSALLTPGGRRAR